LGTFIAGPLGGLVGAISGVGTKQGQQNVFYLIIHYTNLEGIDTLCIFTASGFADIELIKNISKIINKKVGYKSDIKNETVYEI